MNARRARLDWAEPSDVSHAGLVLARCLGTPVKADGHEDARRRLLEYAEKACGRAATLYKIAFDEREEHFDAIGAETFTATIDSRLAVGLGTASPIEVGLRLHHNYGTPVIPGSALKGVCARAWRAWVKSQNIAKDDAVSVWKIIFGQTAPRQPDSAGFITFHDAWIVPGSLPGCLRRDVMTPHHTDYYSGKKPGDRSRAPPTDFDSPVPIPFVSVRGSMHFALSVADPSERGIAWLQLATALLQFALGELGVGGKTTSGYGRFSAFDPSVGLPGPASQESASPTSANTSGPP